MDASVEEHPPSSDAPPIFKFVLPVLIGVGFLTLALATVEGGIGPVLFMVAVGVVIGFLVHEYLPPLKRVAAPQHGLTIGNYRSTIAVPFTDVSAVARAYKRWDIVEIGFRTETQFGRSVVFMAGARIFPF